MNVRRQGIAHATLIAPDLERACLAYTGQLSMTVASRGQLDAADAGVLGRPDLIGAAIAWLANSTGEPILRVIADPQARVSTPMLRHGWLALEILVGDVDALAAGLREPFQVSAHRPTWNSATQSAPPRCSALAANCSISPRSSGRCRRSTCR